MEITNPELLAIFSESINRHARARGHTANIETARLNRRRRDGRITHAATLLVCSTRDDGSTFYSVVRFVKCEGVWQHSVTVSAFGELETMADLCDLAVERIEAQRPAPPRLRIAPPVREVPPDDDGKPLAPERIAMPRRSLVGGRRDG